MSGIQKETGVVLIFVLPIILLAAVVVGQSPPKNEAMAIGYFEMRTDPADPRWQEVVKAMEFSDMVQSFSKSTPVDFEITKPGPNRYTSNYVTKYLTYSVSFSLNVEQPEDFPNGQKCKMLVKMEGDTRVAIYRQFVKGWNSTMYADLSNDGIHATVIAKDKTAYLYFARVKKGEAKKPKNEGIIGRLF